MPAKLIPSWRTLHITSAGKNIGIEYIAGPTNWDFEVREVKSEIGKVGAG